MRADISLALTSLSSNRLRTVLTITIIAIGITSLVGIETAIDILTEEVAGSFSRMGASMVCIKAREESGGITYREASLFIKNREEGTASLKVHILEMAEASHREVRSDPVVTLMASDRSRVHCGGLDIAEGRNFSENEMQRCASVCIIGDALRKKLFGVQPAVGNLIRIGGAAFTVSGVLKRQGAFFGDSYDNTVIIPVTTARGRFIDDSTPLTIDLAVSLNDSEREKDEAGILMREVRRIAPGEEDDFEMTSGETLQGKLSSIKHKLSLAALVTGLITILGASVALMNILLVSVRERTHEIGLRKAIGEKVSSIRFQFLLESVIIGQIGGIAGITAGLLSGNIVAMVLEGSFTVPWPWIVSAIAICFAVSLASGSLPADRAARLNPVDALRAE